MEQLQGCLLGWRDFSKYHPEFLGDFLVRKTGVKVLENLLVSPAK
jgi:hypothetical protein